jgi:outer membrane receptor protein involved in Fe transport
MMRNSVILATGIVAASLFFPPPATAAPAVENHEQPRQTEGQVSAAPAPVVAEEITVTGKRTPPKIEVSPDVRTLPASVAVMTAAEIAAAPRRDAGEVIRALPGVDYVYYGQGGIPSGPSVRGYTDRNFGQDMAGFMDGIPLNLFGFVASHGALDLTPIFPEAVERIELIRGPFAARYGDFHRGASLNFVTRDGVTEPAINLSIGSFGAVRAVGTWGNYDPNRTSVYANIDAYTIDGYADNQGLQHLRSFNKLHVPLGASDLTVTALLFTSEWDSPGYLSKQRVERGEVGERAAGNPTDGGSLDQLLLSLRYRLGPNSANPLIATVYGSTRQWERFRHDAIISPAQTQVRQIDERTTLGARVEKIFGGDLAGRPSLFTIGATTHYDDADTRQDQTLRRTVTGAIDNVHVELLNSGIYVEEELQMLSWLKLAGGLRYSQIRYDIDDRIRAPGTYVDSYSTSKVNPKIGVVVAPMAGLELFAQYASGMRSPTPRTEIRNSIGSIDRITVAETENYEIGAVFRPVARFELRADFWRADNSNEVRGIPPGGVQFESLGQSRREGYDLEMVYFTGAATMLFANHSSVDARLLTPVNPLAVYLPDVPDSVSQAGVRSALDAGRGRVAFGVDAARYGRKYLNTLGTIRGDSYERITANATWLAAASPMRLWAKAVSYPGSRFGESEFLFGQTVGVRPNPRLMLELGAGYSF